MKDRAMNILRKLFSPSSKRIRKSAKTIVNDLSFETLDRRIVFDAAGLDMPALGPASDAVITEAIQPQTSINFPFSTNKTICPINFTTDESDIGQPNSSHINFGPSMSADSKLTNTDQAFADLSWLRLASTNTTVQEIAESGSYSKDKFTTILSEFSENK